MEETRAFCLTDWIPFNQAWDEFAKKHSVLGVSPGRGPMKYAQRVHGRTLLTTEAVRRAANGRWFAHRQHFDGVMFNLLTNAAEKVLGRATVRQQQSV